MATSPEGTGAVYLASATVDAGSDKLDGSEAGLRGEPLADLEGDFATLLRGLDHDHPGLVSVCHRPVGGRFQAEVVTPAEAVTLARRYAADGDVWFGLNTLAQPETGRGTARDVRRLVALCADLDVKAGGMPSIEAAWAVIEDVSEMLGSRPFAVIESGHGLQPLWLVDQQDPDASWDGPDDPRWSAAVALLRRFGRLVRSAAREHGGEVDSVFDLPRLLRVPGTINFKAEPVATGLVLEREWARLTLASIAETFEEWEVPELPEDRESLPAEVVSRAGDWAWAELTCPYARKMVKGWETDLPDARHPWLVCQATRLAALHRLGCLTETDHLQALSRLTVRFLWLLDHHGDRRDQAPGELEDAVAWGSARVEAMPDERVLSEVGGPHGHHGQRPTVSSSVSGATVRDLIEQLRGWQDLPDPAYVIAVVAVAATRGLDDEPCWLLLVAAPSSGKTEAVRLLDGVADERLNDVTVAGLLGWSKGRDSRKIGILSRLGARGLITFGDLSSLLASSDHGGRDAVFGLLRRAYDGHVTRDVSPQGRATTPEQLEWSGRVTTVAAVTGAIDDYSVYADQLGARWVCCRLPERDTEAKRRAGAKSRAGGLAEKRAAARDVATSAVRGAGARVASIVLASAVEEAVEDAALVTCWGRATVPRNGYGRREIEGVATVEEPPRVVRQLLVVARGMLALGLGDEDAAYLARKLALDSMPAVRRAVLEVLSSGEADQSTSAVASASGLHRAVARRALEELEVIGVVTGTRTGHEPEEEQPDRRRCTWTLTGADGDLIAQVFADHQKGSLRWHEVWGPTPPTPITD